VYPLTSCNDCNETFLSADMVISGGVRKLVSPLLQEVDEFMLDRDPEEHDFESEEIQDDEVTVDLGARSPALVISGSSRGASIFLDPQTCGVLTKPVDTALNLRVQDVSFEDKQQVLKCPCCDGAEAQGVQFRKPMLGAPFLLGSVIPTMLEFCPDGDHPLDVPMRGRRMITFTDSRQGTARIAAQLQQDAERTTVRAGVYRKLVTSTAGSSGERAAIESKIAEFNKLLAMVKGTPAAASVEGLLSAEEAALQKLAGGKAVPFQELVQWLASQSQDVGQWIHAYYAESDSLFRATRGRELLTEILLCREFSRRPKRQNSLETMGLASVQYPKLTNARLSETLPGLFYSAALVPQIAVKLGALGWQQGVFQAGTPTQVKRTNHFTPCALADGIAWVTTKRTRSPSCVCIESGSTFRLWQGSNRQLAPRRVGGLDDECKFASAWWWSRAVSRPGRHVLPKHLQGMGLPGDAPRSGYNPSRGNTVSACQANSRGRRKMSADRNACL
jgi:hypothetical protein